ncbi:MAG: hypothetical protein L7S06_05045 [Candidatus Actinomarina sp.]|nr:hypothetical protein [Candidatus Actinomarina sp.]
MNMALTLRKLLQVLLGTTLIGTGVALNFSSKLGLGPWGVFHEGISLNTTLSFGSAIIATGVFVTFLWIPLKQRPGIATFVDIFWIGTVADLVIGLDLDPESLLLKWIFVFIGIICIGSGTAIYVGADMGSGPRDGVMVGLESKGLKIGMARNIIEVTALALGWLLGGTVGLSSVVIAISIGPVVQIVIPYFDLR